MTPMLRVLPMLAVMLAPVYAFGNGVTATFPAGGVRLWDSTDISIAREDLFLGAGEVRVDYVFESSAQEPQIETIGFPLPRVGSAFDSPDAVQDLGTTAGDMRNYLDFGVSVDGQPIIPVLHEFAWIGDREVSAEILAAGLPLLPRQKHWLAAVDELDPETIEALVASGALLQQGESFIEPGWAYQAVYEWQQTFAPGETAVSIHYRPLLGWPGDYGARGRYFSGKLAEAACVDDAFRQKIVDLWEAGYSSYSVAELDYVTTTAQHWSGPIGQFNLTAAATVPDEWSWEDEGAVLVALCPAEVSTDAQGNRHWTVSNYVPERDIHLLYYFFDLH